MILGLKFELQRTRQGRKDEFRDEKSKKKKQHLHILFFQCSDHSE